jgi:hypothetical protein
MATTAAELSPQSDRYCAEPEAARQAPPRPFLTLVCIVSPSTTRLASAAARTSGRRALNAFDDHLASPISPIDAMA